MANNYLILNSRDEYLRIDVDKIMAFESEGNYTNIILPNNVKAMVGMNLSQMKGYLAQCLGDASATFARVGKRHIVNLGMVYRINLQKQRLYLNDGNDYIHMAEVSKEALKQLKAYLTGKTAS